MIINLKGIILSFMNNNIEYFIVKYKNMNYPYNIVSSIFSWNQNEELEFINWLKKEGTPKSWTVLMQYAESRDEIIKYFNMAISLDPDYIQAYIAIILRSKYHDWLTPDEIIEYSNIIIKSNKFVNNTTNWIYKHLANAYRMKKDNVNYAYNVLCHLTVTQEISLPKLTKEEAMEVFSMKPISGFEIFFEMVSEIKNLQLAPGGTEYLAAKERFEKLS